MSLSQQFYQVREQIQTIIIFRQSIKINIWKRRKMPREKSIQRSPNLTLTQSLKSLKKKPSPSSIKKYRESHQYFPSPTNHMPSSKPFQSKTNKHKKTKSKNLVSVVKTSREKSLQKKPSAGKTSTTDGFQSFPGQSRANQNSARSINLGIQSFVGRGNKAPIRTQESRSSFGQIFERVSSVLQEYNERVQTLQKQNKQLKRYIRVLGKEM